MFEFGSKLDVVDSGSRVECRSAIRFNDLIKG
jgi:hypothetical protein